MRVLIPFLIFLACFGSSLAEPPVEKVWLVVGNTAEAEKQADELSRVLTGDFQTVENGSERVAQFQLEPGETHLVREIAGKVVWRRTVSDPVEVWEELQQTGYDVPDGRLLSWTHLVPRQTTSPLRLDDRLEFYAGGRSGLKVTGKLGDNTVSLREVRPGYYVGFYQVKAEDRFLAEVDILAETETGFLDGERAGRIPIEGLPTPKLKNLEQVGYRAWLFQGEASPGDKVELSVAVPVRSLFGHRTKHCNLETVADENGHFEAIANLGTLSDSPQGVLVLTSIDKNGVEVQGEEEDVEFRSRVRRIYARPFRRGFMRVWVPPVCR
jgi:hypothetical protein